MCSPRRRGLEASPRRALAHVFEFLLREDSLVENQPAAALICSGVPLVAGQGPCSPCDVGSLDMALFPGSINGRRNPRTCSLAYTTGYWASGTQTTISFGEITGEPRCRVSRAPLVEKRYEDAGGNRDRVFHDASRHHDLPVHATCVQYFR